MEEVEQVAEKILGLFRQHQCHTGGVLIEQHLLQLSQTLSCTEQDLVRNAINHLKAIELIEIVERDHILEPCYELTEKGDNHIYGGARVTDTRS